MGKRNVSIAMTQDLQKVLNDAAEKKNWPKSKIIQTLLEKHLDLVVNDGTIPIIIQVPSILKEHPDALRQWLSKKLEAIINHWNEETC